jgi:hypothetical protein
MDVAATACAMIVSVVPKVGCVAALVGPRRRASATQVFFLGVLRELIHTCSQACLLSLLFTIGLSIGLVPPSSLLPPITLLTLRMPCTYPRYFFWAVANCLCSLRRLGVGPVSYMEGASCLFTQSMFDVVHFNDSDDAVYVPTVFHWVVYFIFVDTLRMPCTYPRYFFWAVANCLCSLRRLGVGPVSYVEGASCLFTQSMFDVVYSIDSDDAVYVPTVSHRAVANCLCSLRRLGVGPVSYVEVASFLCAQSLFEVVFLIDFGDAVYVPTVSHRAVANCLSSLRRLGVGPVSYVEISS